MRNAASYKTMKPHSTYPEEQEMSEHDHPKIDEAMTDFIETLGAPTSHKDRSVSNIIAKILNEKEQERDATILHDFMHKMLTDLKIAGK